MYGLVEREFLRLGQGVVKVGRTTQGIEKRVAQYPKGSLVLFSCPVRAGAEREAERRLIEVFRVCYKHRPDIGAEYFEDPPRPCW